MEFALFSVAMNNNINNIGEQYIVLVISISLFEAKITESRCESWINESRSLYFFFYSYRQNLSRLHLVSTTGVCWTRWILRSERRVAENIHILRWVSSTNNNVPAILNIPKFLQFTSHSTLYSRLFNEYFYIHVFIWVSTEVSNQI